MAAEELKRGQLDGQTEAAEVRADGGEAIQDVHACEIETGEAAHETETENEIEMVEAARVEIVMVKIESKVGRDHDGVCRAGELGTTGAGAAVDDATEEEPAVVVENMTEVARVEIVIGTRRAFSARMRSFFSSASFVRKA